MKKRHIISLAAAVGLSVIWYLFLLSPALQRRTTLAFQTGDAEEQLADFHRIVAEFPDYFNSQKELAKKKELLLSQLYSRDDILRLFESIENTANMHKIKVVEISPSVEELLRLNKEMPAQDKPQILEISLNLNGNLMNVGGFIKQIEEGNFYKGLTLCNILNLQAGNEKSDILYRFKAVLGTIEGS